MRCRNFLVRGEIEAGVCAPEIAKSGSLKILTERRDTQPPWKETGGGRTRKPLDTNGGSEWGSNPPATGNLPPAGFEDRDDHRTAYASMPMCGNPEISIVSS